MKTNIISKHLDVEITINNNNSIAYRRRLTSDNNDYHHIPALYAALKTAGVSQSWGQAAYKPASTLAEIQPETASIEALINEHVAAHEAEKNRLEAEVMALTRENVTARLWDLYASGRLMMRGENGQVAKLDF